jgi:hypothetical protein
VGNKGDKNSMYIGKLKEENSKMVSQIEKISKEKEELRNKVDYIIYLYFSIPIVKLYRTNILRDPKQRKGRKREEQE